MGARCREAIAIEAGGLRRIRIAEACALPQSEEPDLLRLIYIVSGQGVFRTQGSATAMQQGMAVLVSAAQTAGLDNWPERGGTMWASVIDFAGARTWRAAGRWHAEALALDSPLIIRTGDAIVHHHLEQLSVVEAREKDDLGRHDAQARAAFHLAEVWRKATAARPEPPGVSLSASAIASIKARMDEFSDESYHIDMLAMRSGMNTTAFYQQFKHYTSLSPLQYMTKKRIDKAARLLAAGPTKVQDVARAVGYHDPYYFSRMFRKVLGISPRRYQQVAAQKIVVLGPALLGDLCALGLDARRIVVLLTEETRAKHLMNVEAHPFSWERLAQERPDYIFGTERERPVLERLSGITPTVLIDYKRSPWREHLGTMASQIGMAEVAQSWLHYYDRKAEAVRRQIAERFAGQTVLASRIVGGQARVFGRRRRKLSDVLYRDLQLTAPASASGFGYEDLPDIASLNAFGADHLVLFSDQSAEALALHTGQLKARLYFSRPYPWLHYSALGHDDALNEAERLFQSSN
ncbi:helix-turn-helix domain-containing protein [Paenibacillus sp. IB182496]|uniref:Helix-turn-helix domain-containing protein n=1 Tax=Paenibacillus sabuli TaxID=2772509 RepID=A0A927BQL5_9BACL|nr:helix-turn-helix domain-containing protein [Paenibacillus sabuli]MBD2844131.1 helix-turn-helix domain-containing protein [Paenibacillus sabuli]